MRKNNVIFGYCDPVDFSLLILGETNKIAVFKKRHSPNQVYKEIDISKYEVQDGFEFWVVTNRKAY